MVATAIYSGTMVLWKETTFPLYRAIEKRWNRNVVSRVSAVIVVIFLPISRVSSMAISRARIILIPNTIERNIPVDFCRHLVGKKSDKCLSLW